MVVLNRHVWFSVDVLTAAWCNYPIECLYDGLRP